MPRKPKPKPPDKGVILPPELDDDEEIAGGGIPDDDGYIYLRRSRTANTKGERRGKDAKKQKPAQ